MRIFWKTRKADFVGPDGMEYVVLPTEQTDVLAEQLGDRIAPRLEDPVDDWVRLAISVAFPSVVLPMRAEPDPESGEQARLAHTAAKLGYVARIVEFETITEEDCNLQLTATMSHAHEDGRLGGDWFATVCGTAKILLDISIEEPYDPEAGVILAPVGIGHDMHIQMCVDLLGRLMMTDDDQERDLAGMSIDELVRCWRYGYYIRGCEMSLSDEARTSLAHVTSP